MKVRKADSPNSPAQPIEIQPEKPLSEETNLIARTIEILMQTYNCDPEMSIKLANYYDEMANKAQFFSNGSNCQLQESEGQGSSFTTQLVGMAKNQSLARTKSSQDFTDLSQKFRKMSFSDSQPKSLDHSAEAPSENTVNDSSIVNIVPIRPETPVL